MLYDFFDSLVPSVQLFDLLSQHLPLLHQPLLIFLLYLLYKALIRSDLFENFLPNIVNLFSFFNQLLHLFLQVRLLNFQSFLILIYHVLFNQKRSLVFCEFRLAVAEAVQQCFVFQFVLAGKLDGCWLEFGEFLELCDSAFVKAEFLSSLFIGFLSLLIKCFEIPTLIHRLNQFPIVVNHLPQTVICLPITPLLDDLQAILNPAKNIHNFGLTHGPTFPYLPPSPTPPHIVFITITIHTQLRQATLAPLSQAVVFYHVPHVTDHVVLLFQKL